MKFESKIQNNFYQKEKSTERFRRFLPTVERLEHLNE